MIHMYCPNAPVQCQVQPVQTEIPEPVGVVDDGPAVDVVVLGHGAQVVLVVLTHGGVVFS